jgi:hypothetical protein
MYFSFRPVGIFLFSLVCANVYAQTGDVHLDRFVTPACADNHAGYTEYVDLVVRKSVLYVQADRAHKLEKSAFDTAETGRYAQAMADQKSFVARVGRMDVSHEERLWLDVEKHTKQIYAEGVVADRMSSATPLPSMADTLARIYSFQQQAMNLQPIFKTCMVRGAAPADEIHFHVDKLADPEDNRTSLIRVLNDQTPWIDWCVAGDRKDILTGYTKKANTTVGTVEAARAATPQWRYVREVGFRIYVFADAKDWTAAFVIPSAGSDVKFSEDDQKLIQETVKELQTAQGH